MKHLQKLRWILILLLLIGIAQSCEKDEIIVSPVADSSETKDNTPPDTDSSDNNPEPTPEPEPTPDPAPSDGESETDITLYALEGDNLKKVKDFEVSGSALELQKDVAKHEEVWNLVKKIIPSNYLAKISDFMIYEGGQSGIAGYVFNTKEDLTKWRLGLAIDYAYEGGFNSDGQFAYTVIHEFGHILTLDNTQLDSSIGEASCQNYFVGEGCAKKEAYINDLFSNHWSDIWSEYNNISEEDFSALDAFYEKYRDRFVTPYSATNPAEDIAEVFATFVTRSSTLQVGERAEAKMQSLQNKNELVALKDFILQNTRSSKRRAFYSKGGSWKHGKHVGRSKKGCTHRRATS